MSEFFRGWRRKVGCVTLMMALMLMGGWLRSLASVDFIHAIPEGPMLLSLHSFNGTCGVTVLATLDGSSDSFGKIASTSLISESGAEFDVSRYDTSTLLWQVDRAGLQMTQSVSKIHRITVLVINYWLLVIPLTLLSAWLILWKPKMRV